MPKAYHITHWSDYETSESRKVKELTYYSKPNKLMGEGIGNTLALPEPENVAMLGVWALLEAIASKTARPHRGWLVRNNTPLTASRISALLHCRVSTELLEKALDHFMTAEVGWLEFIEMPECRELLPADSHHTPESGKTPGESTGTLPQEGRKVGSEVEGRKGEGTKKVGSDGLPWASHLPSLSEVQTYATTQRIPLDYVTAKLRAADERKDFAKAGWQNGWRDKLKRFWKADEATWGEQKKNRAPGAAKNAAGSGRPDGWKEGDRDRWWTDALADLQAECAGATLKGDEKNAARLREVMELRRKSK